MPLNKTCTGCNKTKPVSSFHRDKSKSDGLTPRCKDCKKEYRCKYYARTSKQSREYSRRYFQKNQTAIKVYMAQYRKENAEHIIQRVKQYQRENHEHVSEMQKRWHENNPERSRENSRRRNHRRRAREREAPGNFSADDITAMLIEQGGSCVYCGVGIVDNFHIDHITPLSRGGSNYPDNLQLLCPPCNLSKHNKTHKEFLEYLK